MKLPVSKRLIRCASMVPAGARVADIGCDHGYLGISLLLEGKAAFVHACDLRDQPLKNAMENALRFGVAEKMRFSKADGLRALEPQQIDTIVCAGMGGELIANLIEAAPWVRDPKYTLILQPQSSGNDLRRRLSQMGFGLEKEVLEEENGFLYHIILARFGGARPLSPGQEYCSDALLHSGEPLLEAYLQRVAKALFITVEGIRRANDPQSRNLRYYETALEEILAMKEEVKCQV